MTRNLVFTRALMVMMIGLTSCSESRTKVSESPDGGLVVYEGKKLGAGQAPDSVKSYLAATGSVPAANAKPIFEGQDVGQICYNWAGPNELNIRISGGYVDSVVSLWHGPDNHHVTIRYLGAADCAWRKVS
jgi:hypothetical protein